MSNKWKIEVISTQQHSRRINLSITVSVVLLIFTEICPSSKKVWMLVWKHTRSVCFCFLVASLFFHSALTFSWDLILQVLTHVVAIGLSGVTQVSKIMCVLEQSTSRSWTPTIFVTALQVAVGSCQLFDRLNLAFTCGFSAPNHLRNSPLDPLSLPSH